MSRFSNRIDHDMAAQLDRLVCGELAEGDRQRLLAWLDEDIRRWRECAMAFLEAQMWRQALSPPDGAELVECAVERLVPNGTAVPRASQTPQPRSSWRSVAMALAVVLAFLGGAALMRWFQSPDDASHFVSGREKWPPDAPHAPSAGTQLATVPIRTNLDPAVPIQIQLPVAPEAASSGATSAASSISDYERKMWERRGFEVVEETRYLPARLSDGREVVVPVNQVRIRFKGSPMS